MKSYVDCRRHKDDNFVHPNYTGIHDDDTTRGLLIWFHVHIIVHSRISFAICICICVQQGKVKGRNYISSVKFKKRTIIIFLDFVCPSWPALEVKVLEMELWVKRHYCRAGHEGPYCRLTQSSISNTLTSRAVQTRSNEIKENNYSSFLNLTDDIYNIESCQKPFIN